MLLTKTARTWLELQNNRLDLPQKCGGRHCMGTYLQTRKKVSTDFQASGTNILVKTPWNINCQGKRKLFGGSKHIQDTVFWNQGAVNWAAAISTHFNSDMILDIDDINMIWYGCTCTDLAVDVFPTKRCTNSVAFQHDGETLTSSARDPQKKSLSKTSRESLHPNIKTYRSSRKLDHESTRNKVPTKESFTSLTLQLFWRNSKTPGLWSDEKLSKLACHTPTYTVPKLNCEQECTNFAPGSQNGTGIEHHKKENKHLSGCDLSLLSQLQNLSPHPTCYGHNSAASGLDISF